MFRVSPVELEYRKSIDTYKQYMRLYINFIYVYTILYINTRIAETTRYRADRV